MGAAHRRVSRLGARTRKFSRSRASVSVSRDSGAVHGVRLRTARSPGSACVGTNTATARRSCWPHTPAQPATRSGAPRASRGRCPPTSAHPIAFAPDFPAAGAAVFQLPSTPWIPVGAARCHMLRSVGACKPRAFTVSPVPTDMTVSPVQRTVSRGSPSGGSAKPGFTLQQHLRDRKNGRNPVQVGRETMSA